MRREIAEAEAQQRWVCGEAQRRWIGSGGVTLPPRLRDYDYFRGFRALSARCLPVFAISHKVLMNSRTARRSSSLSASPKVWPSFEYPGKVVS